jgi:hypothetical protein
MAAASDEMRALKKLVRRRFPGADGIRYGYSTMPGGDTILWQVLVGDEVVWDAGPAVDELIPGWDRLPDAAALMAQAIPVDVEGDWLVLRLP